MLFNPHARLCHHCNRARNTRHGYVWEWLVLAAAALHAGPAAQLPPVAHAVGDAADDAHAAPAWVSAPGLESCEIADSDYRLFVHGVAQAGLRVHQLLKTMAGQPEAASDAFVDMLLRQSQFQPGRRSSVVDLLFEWHGHSGDGASHAAAAEPAPPPALIPSAVTREMAELWYKRASLFTKLMDAFVLFTFVHRDELLHDEFDRAPRGHAPAVAAAPGAAPVPVRPEVNEKRKAEGRESGLRLPRFRGHRSSLLTNEAIWWLNMAVPPPCRHLWRVRRFVTSVLVPV